MGMILRIASSRIVGQGDIVGRSGYFSLNLSANSVMRGCLDARRTLKSLVADLRISLLPEALIRFGYPVDMFQLDIPIRQDGSEGIPAVILNPYLAIFERMGLILIATVLK